MWLGERLPDPGERRIYGAARQTGLKELFHELDGVTTRDTVADRERRDRRLKAWTEMALGESVREPARAARTTAGTAHTLTAMLDDPDRDNRELFDLVARRLTQRIPVAVAEDIAAVAARRPVLDELINRPRWQQWTPVTLMTRLPARFSPRRILAAPGSAPRRV